MTKEEQERWQLECLKYTQLKTSYPESVKDQWRRNYLDFLLRNYEEQQK